MVDLRTLGKICIEKGLLSKPLMEFSKEEMVSLCEAVADSTKDFVPPYIDDDEKLIIPFRAPKKYRWWQGGQSGVETLEELGADAHIIKRYDFRKKGLKKT